MTQQPSRTAALTAAARAFHREEPPPWVIDDTLALALAGKQGSELFERLQNGIPREQALGFSRWVAVRTRFTEDCVDAAAAHGVGQYVILGAGFDTFAYRRTDLAGAIRVFEVDQPASQDTKRTRLDELGIEIPGSVRFVPVDFEQHGLADQLVEAGFDYGRPTVVSWIGVTMYLTRDAIDATLADLARCGPGSKVVLTYNQPASLLSGVSANIATTFSDLAAELGERFVSRFSPAEIEGLVRPHGFVDLTHFGVDEARAVYFPHRPNVVLAGAQRILSGTVPSVPK